MTSCVRSVQCLLTEQHKQPTVTHRPVLIHILHLSISFPFSSMLLHTEWSLEYYWAGVQRNKALKRKTGVFLFELIIFMKSLYFVCHYFLSIPNYPLWAGTLVLETMLPSIFNRCLNNKSLVSIKLFLLRYLFHCFFQLLVVLLHLLLPAV